MYGGRPGDEVDSVILSSMGWRNGWDGPLTKKCFVIILCNHFRPVFFYGGGRHTDASLGSTWRARRDNNNKTSFYRRALYTVLYSFHPWVSQLQILWSVFVVHAVSLTSEIFFTPLQRSFVSAIAMHDHDMRRLEAFHMKCQRQIARIRWQDHIRNTEVTTLTGLSPVSESIIRRRNSLFGHVDIRGWRYGPRRLCVNDDDDIAIRQTWVVF